MKRTALFLLAGLVIVCAVPRIAKAQEVDANIWMDYDDSTGDMYVDCEANPDYSTYEYYDITLYCYVDDTDNQNRVAQDTDTEQGSAGVYLYVATELGTNYQAVGTYTMKPVWSQYYPYWLDPFNFYFYTNNPFDLSAPYSWFGPGPQTGPSASRPSARADVSEDEDAGSSLPGRRE